jgi:hypothetical protein
MLTLPRTEDLLNMSFIKIIIKSSLKLRFYGKPLKQNHFAEIVYAAILIFKEKYFAKPSQVYFRILKTGFLVHTQ